MWSVKQIKKDWTHLSQMDGDGQDWIALESTVKLNTGNTITSVTLLYRNYQISLTCLVW